MIITEKETAFVLEKPGMVVTAPADCEAETRDENPYFVMEPLDGSYKISVYAEETAESTAMQDVQLLSEEKLNQLIEKTEQENGEVTFSGSVKADYLIWKENDSQVYYTCKNGKDLRIVMSGDGSMETFISQIEYRSIPDNPMSHFQNLPRQIPFILGGIFLGALIGIGIYYFKKRKKK